MEGAPRRAGRPAGKRKSSNWSSLTRRPQRQPRATTSADESPAEADNLHVEWVQQLHGEPLSLDEPQPLEPQLLEAQPLEAQPDMSQLEKIARDLITLNHYDELFESERVENEKLLPAAAALPASSYRRDRLRGEAAIRYDRRRRNQQRDEYAIKLHANNQQHWSPSLIARSVAYFAKSSRFVRQNETRQRRIASRPTTLNVLRLMKEHRPQPKWKQGPHVKVFGFDQTYQWVGMKKRGRRQAVEHLDGAGLPSQINHEVYINSIHVPLPATLGTLSQVCIAHAHAYAHMHASSTHTCTYCS